MRRWFASVLPGSEFLGAFLAIYLCIEAVYWLVVLIGGAQPPEAMTAARDSVVLMAAAAYGFLRVTRFHPLYDTTYRQWLETTPWTAARPLPVGPVHLVVQDVVVVLGLMLLTLPRLNLPSISMADGALISLLGGWWIFVIAALWMEGAGGAPQRLPLIAWLVPLSFVPLAFGAGIRATLYGWAYKPPISFWGRIRTFRWIIPGYDRAVMAPGAALVIPQAALLVAGLALPRDLVSPAVLCALPITVGLLILLNGQPSLASWQLTGQHRIVPGYTKNKTFPALTGDYFDEVVEI